MKVFYRHNTSSQRKLGSQQVGQDSSFRWDDVLFFILIIFFFFSTNLFALSPEQHLPEPQEQRARELFLQIKCPVCAGQVIESSDTEIAFQLRKLVREKIADGKSDQEIKIYLVAEYGEDILNSPPFDIKNFLLWVLPAIFLAAGLLIIQRFTKFSV